MENFILFIRLSRPLFLIGVALLYALGAGIARYLGININLHTYILGQLWVTLLQLSTQYLNEYYDFSGDKVNPNRTLFTGGSGAIGEGKLPRRIAFISGLTCLAFLASLTVILVQQQILTPLALLIMFMAFIGAFFYSTPPIRLEGTGYGELVASIIVAFLVPSFAFVLQAQELHRLVAMSTFPLTSLHLAMLLAFDLPDYSADLKSGKRTLIVRMGCNYGMILHNILVLSAYLLLVLAALQGLPAFIWIPAFFTLPIGIFLIWQMRQISQGAKPNWSSLTITAITLFGLMAYLITFAYWIH